MNNKNSNYIQKPHLFAIVSWGCAATWWIAKALNSHHDIYCVHANNNHWKMLGIAQKLDGVEYMKVIEADGFFYAAAGDIHGISRDEIQHLKSYYGDRFSFCVVIRDPISRLKSHLSHLIKSPEKRDLSYLDKLIIGFVLPKRNYTEEEKFFIHACNSLNRITDELKVGRIFRCEDLTTSPQAMLELVKHISNGKVSADLAWAENIIKMPPVNPHKKQDIIFDDWHIEILSRVVKKESWEAYSELGYKLPDFLIRDSIQKAYKNKYEQPSHIQQTEHSAKTTEVSTKSSDTIKEKVNYLSFGKIKQNIKKTPLIGYLLWWVYMIFKTPSKINELFSRLDKINKIVEVYNSKKDKYSPGEKN